MSVSNPALGLLSQLGEQLASLQPAVAQLHTYAYEDQLTGLPNSRVLNEALDQCVTESGKSYWVVFGDLNDFKQLNQDFKHTGADAALQAFGKWLGKTAKKHEARAFRRSGDEFVLIVRRLHLRALLKSLSARPPAATYLGKKIRYQASFGAARLDLKQSDPIKTAMDRAETACMNLKFSKGIATAKWTRGMKKIATERWTCGNGECGCKTNMSFPPSVAVPSKVACPACGVPQPTHR